VVVELPTAEAVRVRPGQAARLTGWGGAGALEARVRLVEPGAYTKVSPLGVEEQRVKVLLDPRGTGWEALGDGYAADVTVVVREHAEVVRVPSSALFRAGGGDALFLVDGGKARLVRVEVAGRSGGLAAVASGLEPGARAVIHPGDQVSDGVRVRPR
jgi:HlyD family secretion protein